MNRETRPSFSGRMTAARWERPRGSHHDPATASLKKAAESDHRTFRPLGGTSISVTGNEIIFSGNILPASGKLSPATPSLLGVATTESNLGEKVLERLQDAQKRFEAWFKAPTGPTEPSLGPTSGPILPFPRVDRQKGHGLPPAVQIAAGVGLATTAAVVWEVTRPSEALAQEPTPTPEGEERSEAERAIWSLCASTLSPEEQRGIKGKLATMREETLAALETAIEEGNLEGGDYWWREILASPRLLVDKCSPGIMLKNLKDGQSYIWDGKSGQLIEVTFLADEEFLFAEDEKGYFGIDAQGRLQGAVVRVEKGKLVWQKTVLEVTSDSLDVHQTLGEKGKKVGYLEKGDLVMLMEVDEETGWLKISGQVRRKGKFPGWTTGIWVAAGQTKLLGEKGKVVGGPTEKEPLPEEEEVLPKPGYRFLTVPEGQTVAAYVEENGIGQLRGDTAVMVRDMAGGETDIRLKVGELVRVVRVTPEGLIHIRREDDTEGMLWAQGSTAQTHLEAVIEIRGAVPLPEGYPPLPATCKGGPCITYGPEGKEGKWYGYLRDGTRVAELVENKSRWPNFPERFWDITVPLPEGNPTPQEVLAHLETTWSAELTESEKQFLREAFAAYLPKLTAGEKQLLLGIKSLGVLSKRERSGQWGDEVWLDGRVLGREGSLSIETRRANVVLHTVHEAYHVWQQKLIGVICNPHFDLEQATHQMTLEMLSRFNVTPASIQEEQTTITSRSYPSCWYQPEKFSRLLEELLTKEEMAKRPEPVVVTALTTEVHGEWVLSGSSG